MRARARSFESLAADVYWIRAIQHYGGERLAQGPRNYDLLYPLLDLTTSLDPYFSIAYRFGAIFLSEQYPGGPGRRRAPKLEGVFVRRETHANVAAREKRLEIVGAT